MGVLFCMKRILPGCRRISCIQVHCAHQWGCPSHCSFVNSSDLGTDKVFTWSLVWKLHSNRPSPPPTASQCSPKPPTGHLHPISTNKDLHGHPRSHHSRHGAAQDPQQQHRGGGQPGPHPPSGAQDGGRATNGHQQLLMTINGAEGPIGHLKEIHECQAQGF